MKNVGWARNHSPLPSQWELRAGGGGPREWKLLHVTTPHCPTLAGRDARGPQIRAGPQNSGLMGKGVASSWERRRPRRPIVIAWNEKRRMGAESLPSPVAMGATRRGWGFSPIKAPSTSQHSTTPPMRAGMPADHKLAPTPATTLPHAGEGAGTPRDPHQRMLANALTRPHYRPMQAGMPADHRSLWTKKQSQGCEITRCQTIRGRWPGPGQGWWRSSVATQTHHAQVPGSAKPVRNIPPKARSRPAPSQSP